MRAGVAVIGVAFVALLGVRLVAARRARAVSGRSERTATRVAVRPVLRRDLESTVTFTEVVRPRSEVDVFTKNPGRVIEVRVEVGDRVRALQTLAEIDHREIDWQMRQTSSQAHVAEAVLSQARTNLETARAQFERYRALHAQNAVAPAELERVLAAFHGAESAARASEAQLGVARAAAGLAGEALRNAHVTTPIDGTITKRNVDVGTHVSLAQPLFQVQDVSTLEVQGAVGGDEFLRLRVGAEARVTVDDLPDDVFVGRVATLSPTLDAQTRRAAVEVLVENPGRLLPNMFARVRVVVGVRAGMLVVPASAVVATPGGRAVFVVRGGVARAVRASFGVQEGAWIELRAGLSEGDPIVVAGQLDVVDGAPVSLAPDAEPEAGTP